MADIATGWRIDAGDWSVVAPEQVIWTDETGRAIVDEAGRPVSYVFTAGGDLAVGDDLFTAVLISLFCDAAAGDDDAIPDGSGDPRGWWAGEIGSRLWLRARARANAATLAIVKVDIEQALAWLVTDGVAARIDVTTAWAAPGLLGALVLILRTDGTRRALRFAYLWENS
ncbi:phage GP46 family protein [Sphingomonas sp. S-NIH.Pt15_0812]|uniref:phage GP46 family protein n=1 Tax=Sphingomonas sp. S-NIH.Pt15_0812 TaxID=1920129 RepID=UPI000F7E4D55|nr:phage GP46 family protein [Sphingomonas sp. S-NIH.Pt15_0812]RSU46350.1 hypothetical protein BRX43_15935 [Sphingomonas sp. S-NIH.Pt15_0812]